MKYGRNPDNPNIIRREDQPAPQFAEPTFGQLASITTKALLIAKVTGAAPQTTWGQVFMPMIVAAIFPTIMIVILLIAVSFKGTP
jgi:hypothetical protein